MVLKCKLEISIKTMEMIAGRRQHSQGYSLSRNFVFEPWGLQSKENNILLINNLFLAEDVIYYLMTCCILNTESDAEKWIYVSNTAIFSCKKLVNTFL